MKAPLWLIYIARDRVGLGFLSYREKAAESESLHNVAIGFGIRIRVRVRQCKSAIIRHSHVLWKRRASFPLIILYTYFSKDTVVNLSSYLTRTSKWDKCSSSPDYDSSILSKSEFFSLILSLFKANIKLRRRFRFLTSINKPLARFPPVIKLIHV